jgi:hypothetical protein
MTSPQIVKDVWVRRIHDTWANTAGWRTDIAKSVLDNPSIRQAVFVLDDKRALFVNMQELRSAVADCPIRSTGKVGPFEVEPHSSTINGRAVKMEIKLPKDKQSSGELSSDD